MTPARLDEIREWAESGDHAYKYSGPLVELLDEVGRLAAERRALAHELHTTLRAAGWAPMRGSALPSVLADIGEAP